MSEEAWMPFGATEADLEARAVLLDDVPAWMQASLVGWIADELCVNRRYDEEVGLRVERELRLIMPHGLLYRDPLASWVKTRLTPRRQLQLADYLLATAGRLAARSLSMALEQAGSKWTVGERVGRVGLVARVPEGVEKTVDHVIASGDAGRRLAQAWSEALGMNPDPSKAYSLAVKAVEDAAIPVVCPLAKDKATLGTVIRDMKAQGNWSLPLGREADDAPSGEVVIGMMRMLWHGQHDRHGGLVTRPPITEDEAMVAVMTAASLVQWITSGSLARRS